MKDVIARLILAYRRELELYGEVLDLAHEGVAAVRDRRPLQELQAINTRKQARLAEIDAIERAIAADKTTWHDTPRATLDSPDLRALLERLTDRIEQIPARRARNRPVDRPGRGPGDRAATQHLRTTPCAKPYSKTCR